MAARPGYGQPDPRNPFANPPQQQYAPRREYDAESDMSDQYGRSESTTHLAANYDQNSPYDSYSGVWIHSVVVIIFLSPCSSPPHWIVLGEPRIRQIHVSLTFIVRQVAPTLMASIAVTHPHPLSSLARAMALGLWAPVTHIPLGPQTSKSPSPTKRSRTFS